MHVVKLVDSLGSLSILLPNRFDTFFTWTHYSDCGKSCDEIKYRFQPKNLPIIKESGWYWDEPTDSVERLTISHSGYIPYRPERDSLFISFHKERQKDNLLSVPGNKIASDTIEKIGNRYFSIIRMEQYDSTSKVFSKKLLAGCSLHGNIIHFDFELLSKDKSANTQKFIENMRYYLRRITVRDR